jgi:hypothetical protein
MKFFLFNLALFIHVTILFFMEFLLIAFKFLHVCGEGIEFNDPV